MSLETTIRNGSLTKVRLTPSIGHRGESELRAAFHLSPGYMDLIHQFQETRIAAIGHAQTPVTLPPSLKLVLHLLPVSSFIAPRDLAIEKIAGHSQLMRPICQGLWNERFNADGFLTCLGDGRYNGIAYTQLFRNGIIEAVDSSPRLTDGSLLLPIYYERALVNALPGQLAVLTLLEIDPPLVLFLTVVGANGYRIATMVSITGDDRENRIESDVLNTPEIILDNYDRPAAEIFKPAFDSIWKECGFPHSLNYNAAGEWRVR